MKKKLTNEILEQIMKDVNSGELSLTVLSEKYGFSKTTISSKLRDRGISLRKIKTKKTLERNTSICRDREQGMTFEELNVKYNIPMPSLRATVSRAKIDNDPVIEKSESEPVKETKREVIRVRDGRGITYRYR